MFNYINADTQDLLSYRDDSYDRGFVTKPVDKTVLKDIVKGMRGADYRHSKLSKTNPLIPLELLGKNKDISYVQFDKFKGAGVGVAFVGKYREGSKDPDELSVYLGRETMIDGEKQFTLFKKLKDTAGTRDFYKYGNSTYTAKNRLIFGGSDNREGTTVIKNSVYEIMQMSRMFFKKAELENSKEWQLMESIKKFDLSAIDDKPYYPKSDSWSIKSDKLTSGSLESAVFDMSQISDASILKPKSSIGEQYNVKSFFNAEVFESVKPAIKRDSKNHRVGFESYLNELKKSELDTDAPVKFDITDAASKLKKNLYDYEESVIKNNFLPSDSLLETFNDKGKFTIYDARKKIDNFLNRNKAQDVLNKKSMLEDTMLETIAYRLKSDKTEARKKAKDFKFSKDEISKFIDQTDYKFKKVEELYTRRMLDVVSSKLDEVIDEKKYKNILSNSSKENYNSTLSIIKNEVVRNFYDKYNFNMEFLDLIRDRRSKTKVSENELSALQVDIKRDKEGNITSIKKINDAYRKKNNTIYSKQDAEDSWAYLRASAGTYNMPFNEMSLEKRLEEMEKYKSKHKDIFELHKEKSMLGKYDTLDNYNKALSGASAGMQREMNNGTSISRTYDKIVANIDYETSNLNLSTRVSEYVGGKKMWINVNLELNDGFDRADYIKYIQQDKQAVMKEMALDEQKEISDLVQMYRENNKLQKAVGNRIKNLEHTRPDKYMEAKQELLDFKSILKGHKVKKTRYKDGRYGAKKGAESYSDSYNKIISDMENKYGHRFYSNFTDNKSLVSETELLNKIMKKGSKLDNNTIFNMLLNNDDIVNNSGSSKQTGIVGGDTYLGHAGYGMPGLAWNKVTQRTFQAQDVLGERTFNITNNSGQEVIATRSSINAALLSRTNLTGVGKRSVFYKTEELVKDTIEHIRVNNDLRDMPYRRGETYKTFAIGDVNSILPPEGQINAFTASFQEGMTATRALQATTNSIRNKLVRINLDELNYDALGIEKKDVHNLLKNEGSRNEILSKVLSKDLYETIEGRKNLEKFYEKINNSSVIKEMDGSFGSLQAAHRFISDELGYKRNSLSGINSDEAGKMEITKQIMDMLEGADKKFRSTAFATGKNGKVNITNDDFSLKHLSLKPEVGFSVGNLRYNTQDNNIEIMLENIGSIDQGSKGQTSGAKYTISEVYDFLKVKSKNKEVFVDAIFNNKTEKRMQTGMMVHSVLQTAVTNIYEDLGDKGINRLNDEMKDVLQDLGVEIKLSKEFGVLIDETYLTKDMKGKSITAEKFMEMSKDPMENQQKLFTEKGKQIFDRIEKKYGASYYTPDGVLKKNQVGHYGVLSHIQKAYGSVYDYFGAEENVFMLGDASIEGYADGGASKFGSGPLLLLKLPSERVNSNANKKKDSGLKVGKGMNELIRVNGYDKLADYIQSKNQLKVNDYLGGVYNNLTNADVLNTIYDHNSNIDMDKLVDSVAASTKNGVVFDLSKIADDDYLLNKSDVFLSHDKLMRHSAIGKAMVDKGLGAVSNGKLESNVNVVVNDKNVNELAEQIKNKIDIAKDYFSKQEDKYSKSVVNNLEEITNFTKMNDTELKELSKDITKSKKTIDTAIYNLSKTAGNDVEIESLIMTNSMLGLFEKNIKNKYSLNQLQTIFKTGNVLTSMELGYDVSETDGTIVSSEVFSRLRNIADKSKSYERGKEHSYDFVKRVMSKEEGVIENTFKDYKKFFENNDQSFDKFEVFHKLINEADFKDEKTNEIIGEIKTNLQKRKLHELGVRSANDFLKNKMNTLKMTNAELHDAMGDLRTRLDSEMEDILSSNKKISEALSSTSVSNEINNKLNNIIAGNEKLKDNKSFLDTFKSEIRSHSQKGFDLMSEYIKIPDEAKSIHKNKGQLSSAQKFKIKSSFIANPIEGSNLLNKFENVMFEGVGSVDDIKQNLEEFGDFMGFKLINEKLFEEDGVNFLDELSSDSGNFNKGVEKARKIFSKNLANVSEVTITSKDYLKAFRDKDFEYKDLYTGADINEKGFIRDMSFFARHPQQTVNHMGGVQSIVMDTKSENLNNKFARSALTFLSEEKNQAGVITVGKKTMLFRRGDHDGDKISQAYVDFISDKEIKNETLSNMLLEFQIKNNILGEWDDVKGTYTKFTGDIIGKDGQLVDLSKVDNAMGIIEETLGLSQEELNMKTKMLNNFAFSVEGRAHKELGKHYNAIYDIMANLSDVSDEHKKLSHSQLDSLEKAIRLSSDVKHHDISKLNGKRLSEDAITVGSNYARQGIQNSLDVVEMLKKGNYNKRELREKINGMDVIGATALFRLAKEGGDITGEDLFKKAYKDVDKFVSRGSFDKFYAYKNTTGVFDELTGIRNTGKTHSYATRLRLSGVEMQKIDVTNLMDKIGNYGNYDKTNPDVLREMTRKQLYYNQASDLFYDNMIESAISAKHGLTLGGLEGSKIFIDSLLSKDSKTLNDKTVRMFDKIFIENSEKEMINFADKLLTFNESYKKINSNLEDVISSVEKNKLNKDLFLSSFEFDDKFYSKKLKEAGVSSKDINKYIGFKKEYKKGLAQIENQLLDEVKKVKNIDYADFEIFKGLHLFGELMIQNEPNSEYDFSKVQELISKYKNNEMNFEELNKNYEFRKFKSQTYTTLGTAAGISNVANTRDYIDAFYKNYHSHNITTDFLKSMSKATGVDVNDIIANFDDNFTLKNETFLDGKDADKIEKISKYFRGQMADKQMQFTLDVQRNPVGAYANALNRNITEFTSVGYDGEKSLQIINDHIDKGFASINDSTYSNAIDNLGSMKNSRLSDISLHYSEYDESFSKMVAGEGIDSLDEGMKLGYIRQAERAIDEYLFKNARKSMRVMSGSDLFGNDVIPILVENKLNKLSDFDKEMVSVGKAVVIKGTDVKDFEELGKVLKTRSNIKFHFDKNAVFFPAGLSDEEAIKAFTGLYENNRNLYVGDSVSNTVIRNSPKYRKLIEDATLDRKSLVEELINASVHLKEDISVDNVSKRMRGAFDSRLASRMKFAEMVKGDREFFNEMRKDKEVYREFKRSFVNNLEGILSDFSKIDSSIKNNYVDDHYVNVARNMANNKQKYRKMEEVLSDSKKIQTFKRLSGKLDSIIKSNDDWFDKEDISKDLFKKISTMELFNKFSSGEKVDINNVVLDAAKNMNGKEYDYRKFKGSEKFIKDIPINKKSVGIATGIAISALALSKLGERVEPIKPNNGQYVLGKTGYDVTAETANEMLDNSSLANNPMQIRELAENLDIPEYISIIKKTYF